MHDIADSGPTTVLRGSSPVTAACCITLQGSVQGCGVRPAIVHLARRLGVTGWVSNTGDQVLIQVQASVEKVQEFIAALPSALPALARLDSMKIADLAINDDRYEFEIRQHSGVAHLSGIPEIPADRAICDACERELLDPHARRYQWPFISCTACGPRYSWLQSLPFLRANTTFSRFHPCAACADEFAHASSRRFGMELIACEQCGPQLFFRDASGERSGNTVWQHVVSVLRDGGIVALQGFSGFHLLVLASDASAVNRLRQFKAREAKPLAIMVASLSAAEEWVVLSEAERVWLTGAHRPIVLLKKRLNLPQNHWMYGENVAPENPCLGVMLPHNGIQRLILNALEQPVIATSANRHGEPVAGSLDEIVPWLGQGIDAICYHDVPLWQVQDDSVIADLADGPLLLRRARGFVHEVLPAVSLRLNSIDSQPSGVHNVMGEGAFLKNTIALRMNERALVSQYIGDLESVEVNARKEQIKSRLLRLCGLTPTEIAIDAHPEFELSNPDTPVRKVYHHHAHAAALLAEVNLQMPALIAAWDGIGYGGSERWWGSEVFEFNTTPDFADSNERIGLLVSRPRAGLQGFALPGGDKCSREPWRVMVALLIAAGIEKDQVLHFMQTRLSGLDAPAAVQRLVIESLGGTATFPMGTSMGRFLEALSVLVLGVATNRFEAQAACRLEYAAGTRVVINDRLFDMPVMVDDDGVARWQWHAMVRSLWQLRQNAMDCQYVAGAVMQSVAEALLSQCELAHVKTLGVSGGCFQNRYLLEYLALRCQQKEMTLVRPQRLPPNDGAIAYGQVQLI